ncbi:MAG: hypothetical protein V4672_21520 [Verrucomicrobiota bacterium]
MDQLLRHNPAQEKRFQSLIQQIPAEALKGIAAEAGYSRLQANPRALALEWLAREVKNRPDLLQRQGPVKERWRLMREMVADFQARLGLRSNVGRSLDAQVTSLLERARDQATKKRTPAPDAVHPQVGPRLAFSLPIRQDKPASWAAVKPGHRWMSAKKFLPKLNDARPVANQRGAFEIMVKNLAQDLKNQPPTLKDPWGSTVLVASPQTKGQFDSPFENRAAHLLGEEKPKGSEIRHPRQDKILWQGAIRQTISDAQVRVRDGAETLYFRTYKEGIHMVVTADGKVVDQDLVLISQYPPDMAKHPFGAQSIVEKVR